MKKILLAAAFILSAQFAMAQPNEKYIAAMKKNLETMDAAFKSPASLLALANQFERIAVAEKKEWLAYYYAALLQVNTAFMQQDPSGMDAIAGKASALINSADSLSANNSEISCVKAMIATVRMLVNPMERYMQYGPEIETNLENAKAQDAANPRPYYLKGENLKNTPEQFGGGCATALPLLQTAKEKFAAFKPVSEMHPTWGLQRVELLLAQCK